MELGVSVIICCYNSAKRLPETLMHLALQAVPANIPWEIILVDNASSDNTVKIAREVWAKYDLQRVNFKILEELNPGKIYALEKAFKVAKYEYLLTCDDDNWLCSDYVATAFQILSSDDSVGALGGRALLNVQEPALLAEKELMEITVHGSQPWADKDHWVYGAGSLYRKSVVNGLASKGWRLICSGRTGSNLISGEDVEICFMIYLCGYKVVADDRLTFKHFVPVDKQNLAYLARMAYWLSYSYYLLYAYLVILNDEKKSINRLSFILLKVHTRAVFKLAIKLAFECLILWKSPTMNLKKKILANLGMAFSILQNRQKVVKHHQHVLEFLKNNQDLFYQNKFTAHNV